MLVSIPVNLAIHRTSPTYDRNSLLVSIHNPHSPISFNTVRHRFTKSPYSPYVIQTNFPPSPPSVFFSRTFSSTTGPAVYVPKRGLSLYAIVAFVFISCNVSNCNRPRESITSFRVNDGVSSVVAVERKRPVVATACRCCCCRCRDAVEGGEALAARASLDTVRDANKVISHATKILRYYYDVLFDF